MGPEQAIHRSILTMDIEGYSNRSNPAQASLRAALYDLAAASAADAGLDWSEFGIEDAGDSILLFIPAAVPPARLAGSFIRALDERLAERALQTSPEYSMRLRVALHHGLVDQDAHGWSGDAINLTARLLDAQPLRDVLKAANRARLVFIVSDDLYQDVIRHQYRTIDTAAYRPVTFDVKQQRGITGWIFVPGYPNPPTVDGMTREERQAEHSAPNAPQHPTPHAFPVPPPSLTFNHTTNHTTQTFNGPVSGGVGGGNNVHLHGSDSAGTGS
jgi:hypothetical protein